MHGLNDFWHASGPVEGGERLPCSNPFKLPYVVFKLIIEPRILTGGRVPGQQVQQDRDRCAQWARNSLVHAGARRRVQAGHRACGWGVIADVCDMRCNAPVWGGLGAGCLLWCFCLAAACCRLWRGAGTGCAWEPTDVGFFLRGGSRERGDVGRVQEQRHAIGRQGTGISCCN